MTVMSSSGCLGGACSRRLLRGVPVDPIPIAIRESCVTVGLYGCIDQVEVNEAVVGSLAWSRVRR